MTIRISTLSNGMKVATDLMPQVESAAVGLWVGVGTRDEAPEVNGIAHFLEHMAFKGTRRRSARDIAELIETVGGHLNAYTSREQTAYYARVLAEDVPLAVDILGDILRNSVFDEEELARERAVILQEIGQAIDTPDDIIFDHFQATAFPDQPLGRPVLGLAEVVEKLSRGDLVDYLGRYDAGSMIAVAAGKVDHDRFARDVEAALEGLPAGNPKGSAPAAYKGGSYAESRDLEQVHLVLGFPGVAARDPDYYAHSLYSMILGGGMSSRLFQEVREKRGLVYSIHSFGAAYRDGGTTGIYAGTGEGELAELLPVVCAELKGLAETVTQAELDRARAQLRASTLMARESTSARTESLAHNLLAFDRDVPLEEILDKLAAVDLDAVRRVAATTIAHAPTVATLGPTGGLDPHATVVELLS